MGKGMRYAFPFRALALAALVAIPSGLQAAPASFNYGGHLNLNGNPVNGAAELKFRHFSAPTGGTLVNPNPPVVPTTLNNGDFSAAVDPAALGGLASIQDNWLEVSVRRPGEQNFTPLSPHQQFSSVPGALYAEETAHAGLADRVAAAGIGHAQIAPGAVRPDSLLAGTVVRSINGLTDDVLLQAGAGVTLQSANGTITISAVGGGIGNGWSLGGNAGTTGGQFLGTTDNRPLELRAGNQTALRLSAATNAPGESGVNVLGGFVGNSVATGATGATISGGGKQDADGTPHPNQIVGSYATVAGGFDNFGGDVGTVVGGGSRNRTTDAYATVAGGLQNSALGNSSTVGGGFNNQAGSATGLFATVSGGVNNVADGEFAAVPGGALNVASGVASFAAGRRARATHDGSFVWADYTDENFGSIITNEFAVRARSGVRFDTGGKGLTVDGVLFNPAGTGFPLGDGAVTSTKLSAPNPQPGQLLSVDLNGALLWSVTPPASWALGGNAGTTADQFLGTTDQHPLTLKVGGQQAVRYEFGQGSDFGNNPPNIVGGLANNAAGTGTYGSFIGTGSNLTNASYFSFIGAGTSLEIGTNSPYSVLVGGFDSVLGDNSGGSLVGGGENNRISDSIGAVLTGGIENTITNASGATIAGGQGNVIHNDEADLGGPSQLAVIAGGGANQIAGSANSTISGGANNAIHQGPGGNIGGGQQNRIVNGGWSTIGGGLNNQVNVSAGGGTIGGGANNSIGPGNGTFYNAGYATVPGGYGNTAAGEFSFAAGLYAQATNTGSFVWSDALAGQFDQFFSITDNEFAVRARGGIRFDTGGKGLIVDGFPVGGTSGGPGTPVNAVADGSGHAALEGHATHGAAAVHGVADDSDANTYAAQFDGNVNVNGTLIASQVQVLGNLQVNDVSGLTVNATKLVGNPGSPDGTAVSVKSGGIQVQGAGVGTPTAVYLHRATYETLINPYANALTGFQFLSYGTVLDHPMLNGHPEVLILFSEKDRDLTNGDPDEQLSYYVKYSYNTGRWFITHHGAGYDQSQHAAHYSDTK